MELSLDPLAGALGAHGLTVRRRESALVITDSPAVASACVVRSCKLPRGMTVQVDVRVALPGEPVIVESFAGLGEDKRKALADAFDEFRRSSLPVFLAAFWGQVDPTQVSVEEWAVNGSRWQAFVGNYAVRSSAEKAIEVPTFAFATLEDRIRTLDTRERLCWVRASYCNEGSGQRTAEVLLNNRPWRAAGASFRTAGWPRLRDSTRRGGSSCCAGSGARAGPHSRQEGVTGNPTRTTIAGVPGAASGMRRKG